MQVMNANKLNPENLVAVQLTLRNSPLYTYVGNNQSRAIEVLWLVALLYTFTDGNFSKLTDNNKIFRIDFVSIH